MTEWHSIAPGVVSTIPEMLDGVETQVAELQEMNRFGSVNIPKTTNDQEYFMLNVHSLLTDGPAFVKLDSTNRVVLDHDCVEAASHKVRFRNGGDFLRLQFNGNNQYLRSDGHTFYLSDFISNR